MTAQTEADQITTSSGSNLALALVCLPRQRRRDMNVFYAFCRMVDDIADDESVDPSIRSKRLSEWMCWTSGPEEGEPPLAGAVRDLIVRYGFPVGHLHEIIAGVRMDLDGADYETWEDLRGYCHRVASVVGLVSVEIFGYKNNRCREYALALGLALQTTNILRDVKTDWFNGRRIYLPREDCERFGVDRTDLPAAARGTGFRELMEFEADRAQGFYDDTQRLLPPEDRRRMLASEIMLAIYHKILVRLRRDGFRVFEKDYRLGKAAKAALIARHVIGSWLP